MLSLILNILGSIAVIGNVLLLTIVVVFGKDKMQDRATKIGFRFIQMLMLLNILVTGGLLLC